ncbi:uncharacterized protein TNCV_4836321 [Trichonephila clavipes]|nr:uncharacterized protein TNCV_4836321 [Trichonephila clavipes]
MELKNNKEYIDLGRERKKRLLNPEQVEMKRPIRNDIIDPITQKLQEILNEEHQETQRNASPEQEEDERGPMLTSVIKDLLKKWETVRAMVLEWHPNQADASRVGDLYNDNAINYFRKIPKKRKAIDIGHILQRPISKK